MREEMSLYDLQELESARPPGAPGGEDGWQGDSHTSLLACDNSSELSILLCV